MSEVFSDIQVNFQQARRQIQEMHRALSTTRESNAVLIDVPSKLSKSHASS